MAGELQTEFQSGVTVYAVLRNTSAQVWNTSSLAFESYLTANLANYVISTTEQGTASGHYAGNLPSITTGIYYVTFKQRLGGSAAETDTTIGYGTVDFDVYQAKVWVNTDATNTKDRYTVAFYKNSLPITSGITSVKIEVIKESDGTDLIAQTAMSQVAATGFYSLDSSTRQTSGLSYIIEITFTIDSVARTWNQPWGFSS